MKKVLQVSLLFIALFFINLLVFKLLSSMGFTVVMSETSYVLPPLFSTIVLVLVFPPQKKRK
ncbi:hypothetical protein BU202_08745 [Streptococcus cuniculi]|uniref:Uncharacterized protein n=1 Tax=Streptococcus cuniculi TaxID=1432788 RepID=A0A1Q8E5U7_9STRE|nr:hypothetical protein BU202_08745 [Streptococcus cuniculi]